MRIPEKKTIKIDCISSSRASTNKTEYGVKVAKKNTSEKEAAEQWRQVGVTYTETDRWTGRD